MARARMTRVLVALIALAALSTGIGGAPQLDGTPRLLVVLVVDQMRADYVTKFQKDWKGGFRRLLDRGAWFSQAAYPYLNTITCAGHATISTGSFPMTHGLVLNEWWDRTLGRRVSCTEDPTHPTIAYSGTATGGHSYKWLVVPTLADEIRAQLGTPPRIVTLSLKARSAIMLAGRKATAATWFDRGNWMTSTAYAEAPASFVQAFLAGNPVSADLDQIWARSLPEHAYLYSSPAGSVRLPADWTPTWPHALKNGESQPASASYRVWERSPYADRYLARMALNSVDTLKLGQGPGTDFLGVSFSSLDTLGHDFGPNSQEVQDLLAQLDTTLGALFAHLDDAVGADHYTVALSADHGVAPVPEYMQALGLGGGRIDARDMVARVEKALVPLLGDETHVASAVFTDFYFAPGVYQKLQTNPAAMKAAIDAILATEGVWRVFRSEDLDHATHTEDLAARAAALGFFPGRSGDLIVLPRPYWFSGRSDATPDMFTNSTHGTSHSYDTRVPLFLMGPSLRPGRYLQDATPADIAPTLAFLCGITLPHPDGRVLTEAVVTPAAGVR